MMIKSKVKIQATIPIPAIESSLKKPILWELIISCKEFDLLLSTFNCLSCFLWMLPMTILSFLRSEPKNKKKTLYPYKAPVV